MWKLKSILDRKDKLSEKNFVNKISFSQIFYRQQFQQDACLCHKITRLFLIPVFLHQYLQKFLNQEPYYSYFCCVHTLLEKSKIPPFET